MTNFSTTPPPPPPPMPTGISTAAKPERPAVTIGAALMIVGGALMILGSFLDWLEFAGDSVNGFSDGGGDGTKDGPVFSVLGAIAMAFGFVQLLSKKMLALGIIATVTTGFALAAAFVDLGDVMDATDELNSLGADLGLTASTGPGLYVVVAGCVIAIAGSILTIAKRRA